MNRQIKAKHLGSIKKVFASGGFQADISKLTEPLAKDNVVRNFCTGCGNYLQIIEEGARVLAKKAGFSDLKSFENVYFKSERCLYCDNDITGVVMMPIIKT